MSPRLNKLDPKMHRYTENAPKYFKMAGKTSKRSCSKLAKPFGQKVSMIHSNKQGMHRTRVSYDLLNKAQKSDFELTHR